MGAVTMLITQEVLDLRSWIALLAITRELGPTKVSVREILSFSEAVKGPAFDVALDLSQLNFEPLVSAPSAEGKHAQRVTWNASVWFTEELQRGPRMSHLELHGVPSMLSCACQCGRSLGSPAYVIWVPYAC